MRMIQKENTCCVPWARARMHASNFGAAVELALVPWLLLVPVLGGLHHGRQALHVPQELRGIERVGTRAGRVENGRFVGRRRRQVLVVVLHELEVGEIQVGELRRREHLRLGAGEIESAAGGAVVEGAVGIEFVESAGQEVLDLGGFARVGRVRRQAGELLGAAEVESAEALGLAVIGRGEIGRLAGELEAVVVAPIDRRAQAGAEHGLLVIREAPEEVGAVRYVRRVFDSREIEGRQLSV